MKKGNDYFKEKKVQEIAELGYNDYAEMFEDGYSDEEISKDLGINQEYIRKLREEYLNDY